MLRKFYLIAFLLIVALPVPIGGAWAWRTSSQYVRPHSAPGASSDNTAFPASTVGAGFAPALHSPSQTNLAPAPLPPAAPTACPLPVNVNIRGKMVNLDQCVERTFSYSGTDYNVRVYYRETVSAGNTAACNASENTAGRCEHEITNNDNGSGENLFAISVADEAEDAFRFYMDRSFPVLWSGTTLTIYIAEDPRGGGTPDCNSLNWDDDLVEGGNTFVHRVLAIHEEQHLVQCRDQPAPGWDGFYGEGIARASEDRYESTLDANNTFLFMPEINGVLGNDVIRSSDLTTQSYPTALWWTWLFDQYTGGGETEPALGWPAIREFYDDLDGASTTLQGIKSFITGRGSTFRQDFTDYTLALFSYKYTNITPRLGFIDAEIKSSGNTLSGHSTFGGGPAFNTVNVAMNPRSSRYYEFNPANQCQFITFTFNGNGKPYSFSVMTVNNVNALEKRWTSYSTTFSRTVKTTGLNRVVGVITAIDDFGTVALGRGCTTPTITIQQPTSSLFEMVGLAENPRNFLVRVKVTGTGGSAVAGLTASDFAVELQRSGGPVLNAEILTAAYVMDDYWLLVRAPNNVAGAENGLFYNLTVRLGSANHTRNNSVAYIERTQDVIVVVDRSGSMGGGTGKIEAARNAAQLFFNELADTDQGGLVAFDTNATLVQDLDPVGSGAGSHRSNLLASVPGITPLALTSIGDGMKTAADEHDTDKNPDNICSFVLLSDGHENESQFWADVSAGVIDNACAIHTIALGPQANETLMQQIAGSVPGGSYDYANSSGTVPLSPDAPGFTGLSWQNGLSRLYDFKAILIGGRQRIQTFDKRGDQKLWETGFYVEDGAQALNLAIGWQSPSSIHKFTLVDPNGDVVSTIPGLAPTAGQTAVRRAQPTHEVWFLADPIPGPYTLKVEDLFQEFFVSPSVDSMYQLQAFSPQPGQVFPAGIPVPLVATFVGPDGLLPGAIVSATVSNPSGTVWTQLLHDDGSHGDGEMDDGVYGGFYYPTAASESMPPASPPAEDSNPSQVGSYQVTFNGRWEKIRREAQSSFAVDHPKDGDKNRLPDDWEAHFGVTDPDGDDDNDKLSNYCELLAGTDPRNPDTDGGGESDGSEAPNCYYDPNGQNPFDPADDRTRGPGGVIVRPRLDPKFLPIIVIDWEKWSRSQTFIISRRLLLPAVGNAPAADWQVIAGPITDSHFEDTNVLDGQTYQYAVQGTESTGLAIQATSTFQESPPVTASNDPYAPGGMILINDGAPATQLQYVTLSIIADDQSPPEDGGPPVVPLLGPQPAFPGTPLDDLQMRISNSPDFTGIAWQAFQPVVANWFLGNLQPGQQATVYIQFKDQAGNISTSGFGQAASILYTGLPVYLPLIGK